MEGLPRPSRCCGSRSLYLASEILLARVQAHTAPAPEPTSSLDLLAEQTPFVLDGYGRSDVLERFGSTQQNDFLSDLAVRGFTVDTEALAPYPLSSLSLSSTLDYVASRP